MKVTLKDGSVKEYNEAKSVYDIALDISEGLARVACAGELESELNKIDLIKNVTISFMTERLTFDCNESDLNDALKLIKKIIRREEPDVSIKEL